MVKPLMTTAAVYLGAIGLALLLVSFGFVAGSGVVGVLTGDARDLARFFVVVHLAFTAGFALALRRVSLPSLQRRP